MSNDLSLVTAVPLAKQGRFSHKSAQSRPALGYQKPRSDDADQAVYSRHEKPYRDVPQQERVQTTEPGVQSSPTARIRVGDERSRSGYPSINPRTSQEGPAHVVDNPRHSSSVREPGNGRGARDSVKQGSFSNAGDNSLTAVREESLVRSSRPLPATELALDEADPEDGTGTNFNVLKGTARYFAMIAEDDFEQRAEFLLEYKELLGSKLELFLQEAVAQILNNEVLVARQCMQSLVVLNLCQNCKPNTLRSRVKEMQYKDTKVGKEFRDIILGVAKKAKQIADSKQKNQTPQTPQPLRPQQQEQQQGTRPSSSVLDAKILRRGVAAPSIGRDFDVKDLSIDDPQADNVYDSALENISRIGQKAKVMEVKPNEFEDEEMRELSSRYKEHRSPWFCPGRVFALLWHEPVRELPRRRDTENLEAPDTGDDLGENMTRGPYGELIYSHIRRMVVIKNRAGHCWCLPIGTYGGRALLKRGLNRAQINAHAIIYDTRRNPEPLGKEPETTKPPIAVKLAEGQQLSRTSRLHFGKPFSVEHYTRVMDVGTVI